MQQQARRFDALRDELAAARQETEKTQRERDKTEQKSQAMSTKFGKALKVWFF